MLPCPSIALALTLLFGPQADPAAPGVSPTKAQFRAADQLERERRFEEALALTESAVERLRSPAERQVIARLYLEAADALLRPRAPAAQPDYARAYPLLVQAEQLGDLGPLANAAKLDLLRCADATERLPGERTERAHEYLTTWPDDPHRDEVRLLLASAQAAAGDLLDARDTWLRIANSSADKVLRNRALRRLSTATLASTPEHLADAIAAVDQLIANDDDATAVAPIVSALVDRLVDQPALAARAPEFLERFAARFPDAEVAGRATLRRAGLLQRSGQADRSLALLRAFLSGRATDQLYREASTQLVDTLFLEAERLRNAGEASASEHRAAWFERATTLYQAFLEQVPVDPRVPEVLFAQARMQQSLGHADPAIDAWRRLIARFPEHPLAAEAGYLVATTLAERGLDFDAALAALAAVTGPFAAAARNFEQALRTPSLAVTAARVFRRGEAPEVTIATRNVEQVAVSLFKIDLRDVFLADGRLDQLADLDVGLIRPDQQLTVQIDGYRPFARIEHKLGVTLDDCEAMVVSVRHEQMEARTVVIVSDLDVIGVATRDRLDIVPLERADGSPGGAFTARAAAGGVLLATGAQLDPQRTAIDLDVLATRDRDLASVHLATAGLDVATPVVPTGVLHLDRHTARPGETLGLFGTLRDAEGDRLVVPGTDLAYRLEWWDRTTAVRLRTTPLALSQPAGLFHDAIILPSTLAGDHQIEVRLLRGRGPAEVQLAADSAMVGAFVRPTSTVIVDHAPPAIFVGDLPWISLRALSRDDQPLARSHATIRIGDTPERDCVTDDGGRIRLQLEPRHTRSAGSLALTATIAGLATELHLEITSRTPALTLGGAAIDGLAGVAGEPVTVSLATMLGDGSPAAIPVRLTVIEPDPQLGRIARATESAQTDATGHATWQFTPRFAGVHHLDAEITDEHGLPVRQGADLTIAGDGDGIPIHLLPGVAEPAAGTALPLRIHSEWPDGRGWLVVHHDRLDHVLPITLRRGLIDVSVPVPDWPARFVRVTCVAIRERDVVMPTVHLPTRAALDVQLGALTRIPAGAPAALELELSASDPAGRPVVGEASLWLVDPGRVARLRARLAGLTDALAPAPRGSFVAIGTSASFVPPAIIERWDPAIAQAIADAADASRSSSAAVMVDGLDLQNFVVSRNLPGLAEELKEGDFDDKLGVGGGAGGRFGGKRTSKGGGKAAIHSAAERPYEPAPHAIGHGVAIVDGRGKATLTLPPDLGDRPLAVLALVVSGDNRVGIATAELPRTSDIDLTVSAPAMLRPDDAASVLIALRDASGTERGVDVTVAIRGPGSPARAVGEPRRVALLPFAAVDLAVPIDRLAPGEHTIHVTAGSSTRSCRIDVREPRVLTAIAGRTGTNTPLPLGAPDGSRSRALLVHASPLALLLDGASSQSGDADRSGEDLGASAWQLWESSEALLAIAKVPPEGAPTETRIAALREQAAARLLRLLAHVTTDEAALRSSTRVIGPSAVPEYDGLALIALCRAGDAGLDVPDAVRTRLQDAVRTHLSDAYETIDQAWFLFGLAFAEPSDFARLNRLYRERDTLDARTLSLLAFLLARASRVVETRELLALLHARHQQDDHLVSSSADRDFATSDDEITALAIAAARIAKVQEAWLDAAADWLWTRRDAVGFTRPLAGLVLLPTALDDRAATSVLVGSPDRRGGQQTRLQPWQTLAVPIGDSDGTGAWSVAAEGGRALAVLAVDSAAPAVDTAIGLRLQRRFERTFAMRGGRPYSIGEGVIAPESRNSQFNETDFLLPSQSTQVMVTLRWSDAPTGMYWLFEPLPAGLTLDPTSVSGAAVALIADGGFWLRLPKDKPKNSGVMFSYRVIPRFPGSYSFGDALVRSSRFGAARALPTIAPTALRVAFAGEDPDAAFAPSADERYAIGSDRFQAGDLAAAIDALQPLTARPLQTRPFLEITRMLLLASVGLGADADTVRYFETLKERDPGFVVPFDTMLEVGRAYRRVGEPERARQVFLGVADASFLEASQVVGHLERVDRVAPALAAMERLIGDHADTPVVRSMLFALGQHGYFAARALPDRLDQRARRGLFLDTAARAMERHRTDYPDDPSAEEVWLTEANILLEQQRTDDARRLAATASQRFASGRFVMAFDYIQAYAAFANRDLALAQTLAQQVIDRQSNATETSQLHLADLCRQMTAQILHAQGDLDGARLAYRAIAERFPDAARALRYLDQRGLVVPELTRAAGGEALRVPVELRGPAASVEVRVYPVDLQLLYLKHRGFDHLADVRLAGITPSATLSIPAPATGAALVRRFDVTLDVGDVGAYLLVFRAGDQQARGMAIRSDLQIDVDDADASGTVRVYAALRDGTLASDAVVTLVGSEDTAFVTRRTDLRGVCEAPGLHGRVAVIAHRAGHYAFFQGAAVLRQAEVQQQQNKPGADPGDPAQESDYKNQSQELLERYRADNDEMWKSNTNRRQTGVEVERAKR